MKHTYNLTTLLIITIVITNAYGQEKDSISKPPFNKLQIGVNFSPDICFRTLENSAKSSDVDSAMLKQRNKNETIKLGYTAGLNICLNFNKFWGLEAGIQYSNKGYRTIKQDFTYAVPDPSLPINSRFIYNYQYIDIPLKVNFTFGKSKIRFISSIGLTTNIFLKETQTSVFEYTKSENEKVTYQTSTNFNKINLSPTISSGIDYKINNKMHLKVEPTFRYGVLKIINAPITGYLWSCGLNISFYYGL